MNYVTNRYLFELLDYKVIVAFVGVIFVVMGNSVVSLTVVKERIFFVVDLDRVVNWVFMVGILVIFAMSMTVERSEIYRVFLKFE